MRYYCVLINVNIYIYHQTNFEIKQRMINKKIWTDIYFVLRNIMLYQL